MSGEEKKVPGLTFWLRGSSYEKPEGRVGRAEVHLTCEVHDELLWTEVKELLQGGHRVYTSADFQMEVVNVMRDRIVELEQQKADLEQQVQREKSGRALAEKNLKNYTDQLGVFGRALRGRGFSSSSGST